MPAADGGDGVLDLHGGRAVIQRHASEVETLSWPLAASRDPDRPADYGHAPAALARRGPAFASSVGPPCAESDQEALTKDMP